MATPVNTILSQLLVVVVCMRQALFKVLFFKKEKTSLRTSLTRKRKMSDSLYVSKFDLVENIRDVLDKWDDISLSHLCCTPLPMLNKNPNIEFHNFWSICYQYSKKYETRFPLIVHNRDFLILFKKLVSFSSGLPSAHRRKCDEILAEFKKIVKTRNVKYAAVELFRHTYKLILYVERSVSRDQLDNFVNQSGLEEFITSSWLAQEVDEEFDLWDGSYKTLNGNYFNILSAWDLELEKKKMDPQYELPPIMSLSPDLGILKDDAVIIPMIVTLGATAYPLAQQTHMSIHSEIPEHLIEVRHYEMLLQNNFQNLNDDLPMPTWLLYKSIENFIKFYETTNMYCIIKVYGLLKISFDELPKQKLYKTENSMGFFVQTKNSQIVFDVK